MKVGVRAVGLKAMREKRGRTQRKLAHDLVTSQNYIPAIAAGTRRTGPRTVWDTSHSTRSSRVRSGPFPGLSPA